MRTAMPETSMNKKNRTIPGKYDVWGAGQSLVMKCKAKTLSVQKAANDNLRLRVFLLNGSHHPASLLRKDALGHYSLTPFLKVSYPAAYLALTGFQSRVRVR
jgi:hypothetical protein